MPDVVNDIAKQRLTERSDIVTAVQILKLRGLDKDELTSEITKLFYVDLDTYNEVLQSSWRWTSR